MEGIRIIVDGVEWNGELQIGKAESIEMWWDRSLRLWTLYPVDADGNQIAGATYANNKAEAIMAKKDLAAEYGI